MCDSLRAYHVPYLQANLAGIFFYANSFNAVYKRSPIVTTKAKTKRQFTQVISKDSLETRRVE